MAKTIKTCLKQNRLILSTTFAVIIGLILGFELRQVKLNPEAIAWIQILRQLLIRMFKAIALPLIISCIAVGKLFSNVARGVAILITLLLQLSLKPLRIMNMMI